MVLVAFAVVRAPAPAALARRARAGRRSTSIGVLAAYWSWLRIAAIVY